MDHIISYFEQYGLKMSKRSIDRYYPGSCNQCNFTQRGHKSILYRFCPGLVMLICDSCHDKLESIIIKCIKNLQEETKYHSLKRDKKYTIIDGSGKILEGFLIDERFLFFIKIKNVIHVPLFSNNETIFYPLRSIFIMNDLSFKDGYAG
jgi:hypothetical protein